MDRAKKIQQQIKSSLFRVFVWCCAMDHKSLLAWCRLFLFFVMPVVASLNNQYWIVSVIVSLLRNELFFCTHCLRFGTKQRKQCLLVAETVDLLDRIYSCFIRNGCFFLFCFTLIIQLKGITVHQNSLRPQCNRLSFWNTTLPHRQIAFRCSF